MPGLGMNLMQRPKINPIHGTRKKLITLCRGELREIVGGWTMKDEFRLSVGRECNRCGTSLVILVDRQIFSGKAKLRHAVDDFLSPLVLAHSTDEGDGVP